MPKFGKFIRKAETEVVVARNLFHTEEWEFNRGEGSETPVIFVNQQFAKTNGLKEGQTLKLSTGEKALNFQIKITEDAGKPTIPHSIYSSYLVGFDSYKRFHAGFEVTDSPPTSLSEVMELV
ncbi:MAG: hypothetical protein ACLFVI_06750 [Archaeoglobaceae archaeon]